MMEVIAAILLLLGAFFGLVAALGIVRMPDLYCRMHAATKAGAFGVALMLLGMFFSMPAQRVFIQGALIVFFFYLTAPVAAQMVGHVAIHRGVKLWKPGRQRKAILREP